MRQRVFADHDGVVDDDAERHDQSEQADHVDAATQQEQHCEGRHERNRHAERDPPRHPSVEKQEQHADHQYQAAGAVLDQQHDAFLDQLPGLVVDHHFHPRWPPVAVLRQPVLQQRRGFKAVAVGGAAEQQFHRRTAAPAQQGLAAARATLDGGHVAEVQQSAAGVGAQRHAFEIDLSAALSEGAQLACALVTADHAGGQIARARRNPRGDVVE